MNGTRSTQVVGNRYQILGLLGAGGMGTVYRGLDTTTGAPVAVKSLKSDVDTPEMVERFKREGETLRQLNHPHIVKMLDMVEDDDQHFLVMELVEGGSLSDLLHQQKQLTIRRVLEIALDLSDALARAHRLNIIHRDIKPANVLLAGDSTPRLTDFGIARVKGTKMTHDGAVVGTLAYLSPEVLNGEDADHRSDIWAFGVMLFEMLAGQHPFKAETMSALIAAILTHPLPDLERLCPGIPIALVDLIYRMLDKDRTQRIPSIRAVGAELEAIMEGSAISTSIRREVIIVPDRFATPTPTSTVRHNLPAPPTPFVGREEELAAIQQFMADPQTRLITILGMGGMGKTRLSIEVARGQIKAFEHGVYFVALAPLNASEFIVSTMAEALDFSFASQSDPKTQLLDYLREKELLLVMDNFEHLISGAGLAAEILETAPRVKIIATSRERLNLRAETVYQLGGMLVPADADVIDEYAAGKLFLQSARRAQPGFTFEAEEKVHIARICHLVQGIPLGIELAAAWVEMLRLDEVTGEIERSLDFLETEMRDVPERHRSMRAVFEYSWHLLTEEEQRIFMRLSIFRGGFSREAAQAVTDAGLRPLTALVNKSLLKRDLDGRYQIHELLRQYAETRLHELPDLETEVRDHHSDYYSKFLVDQEKVLWSKQEKKAAQEIEREIENIRAGWNWAIDTRRLDQINAALYCLMLFYDSRGWFKEADETFGHLLQKLDGVDHLYVWRLRAMQAWLAVRIGQYEASRESAEICLEVFRPLDLKREMGLCLAVLCYIAMLQGHYDEAIALADEHIAAAEADPYGLVVAQANKGYAIYLQGDYAEAKRIYESVLALAEKHGSLTAMAVLSSNLGEFLHALREEEQARECFQKSLRISEELGSKRNVAIALHNLGNIGHNTSDLETAKRYYEQSLEIYQDIGDRRGTADSLRTLGEVLFNLNRFHDAIACYRQSLATYEELGDRRGIGDASVLLGFVLGCVGQYDEAKTRLLTSLSLRREIGNVIEVADCLSHLAIRAYLSGDLAESQDYNEQANAIISAPDFPAPQIILRYINNCGALCVLEGRFEEAIPYFVETMTILEKVGYRWAMRIALSFWGEAEYELGNLAKALEFFRRAIQIGIEIQSYDVSMYSVMGMGLVLAAQGEVKRGVELVALASESPQTWDFTHRRARERLTQLESKLSPDVFAAAVECGKNLTFEAVAAALLS